MAEARYDAVADFYAAGFDAIDEPASMALLDLLGSRRASVSWMPRAGTGGLPGNWPGAGRT